MEYIDIIKLYESKDNIINKLNNLTDEQKEEVKAFFRKHNEQEKKVDWNKTEDLTYDNFKKIIDDFNNRNTKSAQKKIANKLGVEGLAEGIDFEYLGEFTTDELGTFKAYVPLSWLGAKTIAGRQVPPINKDKDSAAWCIGYSSDIKFWNNHFLDKEDSFVIICGEDVPTKKVCFEIQNSDSSDVICWDYYDDSYTIDEYFSYCLDLGEDEKLDTQTHHIIFSLFRHAIEFSNKRRPIEQKAYDEEKLKQMEKLKANRMKFDRLSREFILYKKSLPTKDSTFNGYDFPFIQVGERPEGKVFMSKYLTDIPVPFSPRYFGEDYKYGSNRWDVSILRQWLNSDALAGQWYKEPLVDGYKVDWDKTEDEIKDFIRNTPGFLRMVGISKSDLNPVANITYTTEGESIKTVDYVWIPSLSEMGLENHGRIEGEPLDYWKKFSTYNPSRYKASCSRPSESKWYSTRSANAVLDRFLLSIISSGDIFSSLGVCVPIETMALVCFK